mmetsp:Transcript_14924/g.19546  ORF Transcript_14924/g.19546 Transcript_14924/m.19546 type:complete len:311 (+) Transcript_14924:20-952(+)
MSSYQEPTSGYHEPEFDNEPRKSLCTRLRKCCGNLISFGMILFTAAVLWNFMGRPSGQDALRSAKRAWSTLGNIDASDFSNVLGNLSDVDWDKGFNEDPYGGSEDNTTIIWQQAKGYGLTLTLQNALDDNWQTEFAAAFADWQESEALDISTVRVDVDNSCTRVEGVMKVCNGNFGDTGWVGINEIEMIYKNGSNKYISSSVAKMNEFYLNHAAYAKRQYTMCHEIGHGFGLPHTDTNFNNQDTGNCLDYSSSPENNMHPGDINFERLAYAYLKDYSNNNRRTVEEEIWDEQNGKSGNLRRVIVRHYLWA